MDKQNRIFVGGIPVRVDKKVIVDFFSQYGKILHCKIKKNSKTGRSLGYAYLTFENPQAVKILINQQIEFYGRICECKQVFKKEELKDELAKEKRKKLLVYQLDPTITNSELKKLFETFTSISHAYVVKDPDSELNLGYGYVVFHSEEAVNDFNQLKLNITLKGKQILYTNNSHLPPKRTKLGSNSGSFQENSNSRLSQFMDSEYSGSNSPNPQSLLESQLHNSKQPSNSKKSQAYQKALVDRQWLSMEGHSSLVSELAEAGESLFQGNSVSEVYSYPKFFKDCQNQLQGQNLGREIGRNGKWSMTVIDKDNTGCTQTTKISSNQGGRAQLPPKFTLKAKRRILADVLRASPYLNNDLDNYKFNYIQKRRHHAPPVNHILPQYIGFI